MEAILTNETSHMIIGETWRSRLEVGVSSEIVTGLERAIYA